MRYYMVTCRRGHLGTGKKQTINLAIEANDMLAAVDKARSFPGVKHSLLPEAREISKMEYIAYRSKGSAYNRY